MKFKLPSLLILLSAFFLGACTGLAALIADSNPGPLNIWIDAPLEGSNLPLAPYTIVVSTSIEGNAQQDTALFSLLINGHEAAQLAPEYQSGGGSNTYVYSSYDWIPATDGGYTIRVESLAEQGGFAEVNVFVGQLVLIDPGAEGEEPAGEATPTPTQAAEGFVVVPLRDTNCRYGCSASFFDIADTLFEGQIYGPLAVDAQTGFFYFAGPSAGERCWVHNSLLDMQLNGASVDFQTALDSNLLALRSCPANPTSTPTPTSTPEPSSGGGGGGSGSGGGATAPQCSDGVDNDGDGAADYGTLAEVAAGTADRQCTSTADDDETN
jgi:hypothetical protein